MEAFDGTKTAMTNPLPKILILTPIKDAVPYAKSFFKLLAELDYPAECLSLGLLEGDSRDDSFNVFQDLLPSLVGKFRKTAIWKKDFGFQIPPSVDRWAEPLQIPRRAVLDKTSSIPIVSVNSVRGLSITMHGAIRGNCI